MNKKCTNPSCRKTFSTLVTNRVCPHCGKKYPQLSLNANQKKLKAFHITCNGTNKVRLIKVLREFYKLSLKEAKYGVDRIPNTVYYVSEAEAERFKRSLDELAYVYVTYLKLYISLLFPQLNKSLVLHQSYIHLIWSDVDK